MRLVFLKLVRVVATFSVVTFATTFMISLVPGDPAAFIAGDSAPPAVIAALNRQYHYHDSIFTRYWDWLGKLLHGDLGSSYITKLPVWDTITQRFPVTLELAILATLLSLAVSVPLAIACARRPNSRLDRIVTAISSGAISLPSFVVATILLYFLSFQLKLFPSLGWTPLADNPLDNLRTCVLPVISISIAETVTLLRVLRSDLIETLQQDYIALARAKGLSTRAIMWKHALRPSSFSLMTLSGIQLGKFLGATVIVERIFLLPGLGSLALQSISSKDLVVVQGVITCIALAFLAINLVVDLLYGVLDPRTRLQA